MIKCPNCGNTTQMEIIDMMCIDDDTSIRLIRTYQCGCGMLIDTATPYDKVGLELVTDSYMEKDE